MPEDMEHVIRFGNHWIPIGAIGIALGTLLAGAIAWGSLTTQVTSLVASNPPTRDEFNAMATDVTFIKQNMITKTDFQSLKFENTVSTQK